MVSVKCVVHQTRACQRRFGFRPPAAAAGVNMNLQSMNGMLKYFCDRRQCTKNLPETAELNIDGIGKLYAHLGENLLAQKNLQFKQLHRELLLTKQDEPNYAILCQRTVCFRDVAQTIKLDVSNIGSLTAAMARACRYAYCCPSNPRWRTTVGGWHEANDGIFAHAVSVDAQFSNATASAAAYIKCRRCGSMTVNPNQDPADVVESLAAQAVQAGVQITGESMIQMMEYFFKRECRRTQIAPPPQPQQQMGGMGASNIVQQQQYGMEAVWQPMLMLQPLTNRLCYGYR